MQGEDAEEPHVITQLVASGRRVQGAPRALIEIVNSTLL